MSRVRYDGFDRGVMREDFVVRIENRAPLGEDRLLIDVFLRGETGVLVVLDHLEVDEPERKQAEERGKAEANQGAADPAVHFILRRVCWLPVERCLQGAANAARL